MRSLTKKLFFLLLVFSLLPSIGFAQDVILPAQGVTEEVEKIEEPKEVEEPLPPPVPRFTVEPGILAGLSCGTTAIYVEARFPLRPIIGPAATSLRLVGGYAQSKSTDRRYAPLQLDFILNFPPGWFTGVDNYLGFGLNYVVKTTGGTAGDIGRHVFYGVESEGFGGRVYGEMGYGVLRTGFSPDHEGVTVLVGHRRKFSF